MQSIIKGAPTSLYTVIKPQNSFQMQEISNVFKETASDTSNTFWEEEEKNHDSVISEPFHAESWHFYKIVSALVNEIFITV